MGNWQFHFRNFDNKEVAFSTRHAGCAGGGHTVDGRFMCNKLHVPYNPTGGHNSVYVPSSFIIKNQQWAKLIVHSVKTGVDIAIGVVTDGANARSIVMDFANDALDIADLAEHYAQNEIDNLASKLTERFSDSCASIGRTPEQVHQIAQSMGLEEGKYALVGKQAYEQYIHGDNNETNDGHGFSIFADDGSTHIANAAFLANGSLYFYFNSNDKPGFWGDKWAHHG